MVLIKQPHQQRGDEYVLLDGRNRLDAMQLVGMELFEPNSHELKCGIWTGVELLARTEADAEPDPFAIVNSANIHRRHLTAEQKSELIANLLKAQPSKSNRQVAKMVGVSHTHVAARRTELEKSGDVETVATSIDTKGRKQPTRKPPSKKRRDIEDHVAEKAQGADVPGLVPQQTDKKSSAVQSILEAIEKLDDQERAELEAALMQQWPGGLGVPVENAGHH